MAIAIIFYYYHYLLTIRTRTVKIRDMILNLSSLEKGTRTESCNEVGDEEDPSEIRN